MIKKKRLSFHNCKMEDYRRNKKDHSSQTSEILRLTLIMKENKTCKMAK